MSPITDIKRKETKEDVIFFIGKIRYVIESGDVKVNIIKKRRVDEERNPKFTNSYTLAKLFPNKDYVESIKDELLLLTIENYIETVKDVRFSNKTEMRVFGQVFKTEDVYIKMRVELVNVEQAAGGKYIMIMSFHFSERKFKKEDFPFRKIGDCK